MTTKQAKDIIIDIKLKSNIIGRLSDGSIGFWCDTNRPIEHTTNKNYYEALEIAEKVLEKSIPKLWLKGTAAYQCPVCGVIRKRRSNFCDMCGQNLTKSEG